MNGWLAKCDLTIQGSRITNSATNLPILLNESHFPPELMTGCKEDGGDIRFTDSNGDELAREIIHCDKTAGTILIYVRIPELVVNTDQEITVWWSNASASEPAESSPSGSRTVWDDYYGVYHFQNSESGWKEIKDSTGKWSNFSVIGTMDIVEGHQPNTTAANIGPDFGINCHEPYSFLEYPRDMMFWINGNGTAPIGSWSANGIKYGFLAAGRFALEWGGFGTAGDAIAATGWYHLLTRFVAKNVANCYVNSTLSKMNSDTVPGSPSFPNIKPDSTASVMAFGEFRMTRGKNLSLDYYTLMYNLESNPAGIVVPGTPETSSVKNTIKFTGLVPDTEVRIYERNPDGSAGDELAGVEDSLEEYSFEFEFSSEFDVIVRILHLDYVMITYEKITITGDMTIPVQQQFDRNYYDPV